MGSLRSGDVLQQAVHANRIRELQSELFADDLEPPDGSIEWSNQRLHDWFENGGCAAPVLRQHLEEHDCEDLIENLLEEDILSLEGLLERAYVLPVGMRLRLAPAIEHAARQEAERRAAAAKACEEADAADEFRIRLAVHNAQAAGAFDADVLDQSMINPAPLPDGHYLQITSAGSELGGRLWPCSGVSWPALLRSSRDHSKP